MTLDEFSRTGFEWKAAGYFGIPEGPTNSTRPQIENAEVWLTAMDSLAKAKRGDFMQVPKLIQICRSARHPVLARVCSDIVGDAGTNQCFQIMAEELAGAEPPPVSLNYCRALYFQGKLSSIPLLMAIYERFASNRNYDIVPVWISDLLESQAQTLPEPSQLELDEYRNAVLGLYTSVVGSLGSDNDLVFAGKQFGVVSFAEYLLERIRKPYVKTNLRRKFEASTGIDCSSFYKSGEFQPLAAASIVEEFLHSPSSSGYVEGSRYFFGHRIPD